MPSIENSPFYDSPGTAALTEAPISNGTRIVFSRFCSKGPGFRAIAEPDVLPSSWHNTNGIVKMPNRLEATVSNNANAVFPPTVCIQTSTH